MNEWGLPISKDKIIARRNRLIEYQKIGEVRFTPLYEAIDENILDINYMLYEINNLQAKIDKAIEYINSNLTISSILDGKKIYCLNDYSFNYEELLDILKEDK